MKQKDCTPIEVEDMLRLRELDDVQNQFAGSVSKYRHYKVMTNPGEQLDEDELENPIVITGISKKKRQR